MESVPQSAPPVWVDGDLVSGIDRTIASVVRPPAACPGCLTAAGLPWPEGTTTRYCRGCFVRMKRAYQCHRWNADREHQVLAGRASWSAFSARWLASQGLPPRQMAHLRYVAPGSIHGPLGVPLRPTLQAVIHQAWGAGQLLPVAAWLDDDDPPPDPDGLWAGGAAHGGRWEHHG